MPPSIRYALKPQTWAFTLCLGASILSVGALIMLKPSWAAWWALVAVASWIGTRVLNRRDPLPFPYILRWLLLLPRGPHSPQRLAALLGVTSGQRILEVGPGTGTHALPVARWLAPGGALHALDLQDIMLRHVRRRAAKGQITTIVAAQANAQELPYPAGTFDGAYMVATLGEIPDELAALREQRRVLKPKGRLVIAELFYDPDFVSLPALTDVAAAAGFALERTSGPPFWYLALFRPAPQVAQARAEPSGPGARA